MTSIKDKILARLRPAAYEPGDYAKANAEPIRVHKWSLGHLRELWTSKHEEARHPIRKIETKEILDLVEQLEKKTVAFYSKWQLRP